MAPVSAAETPLTPASGERHNSKTWGSEEDAILLHARQQRLNWVTIAERHFPNKSGNACRKRHERLMTKNTPGDWDSAKVEDLARAYMELREQMWKTLAAKLNEKWEIVEKKCMEKGLKNLRSHSRSANRKHRGNTLENDDDEDIENKEFIDSGLGPDLNPGDDVSRDHRNRYSGASQHDQQHPFSGGVSGPPSIYSGRISSAPSCQTSSVASSISYRNTPQQHQQSLPDTLPGFAETFHDIVPVSRY